MQDPNKGEKIRIRETIACAVATCILHPGSGILLFEVRGLKFEVCRLLLGFVQLACGIRHRVIRLPR